LRGDMAEVHPYAAVLPTGTAAVRAGEFGLAWYESHF
jgi:hypothetical protein